MVAETSGLAGIQPGLGLGLVSLSGERAPVDPNLFAVDVDPIIGRQQRDRGGYDFGSARGPDRRPDRRPSILGRFGVPQRANSL